MEGGVAVLQGKAESCPKSHRSVQYIETCNLCLKQQPACRSNGLAGITDKQPYSTASNLTSSQTLRKLSPSSFSRMYQLRQHKVIKKARLMLNGANHPSSMLTAPQKGGSSCPASTRCQNSHSASPSTFLSRSSSRCCPHTGTQQCPGWQLQRLLPLQAFSDKIVLPTVLEKSQFSSELRIILGICLQF